MTGWQDDDVAWQANERIAVVGAGVVSPAGCDLSAFWSRIRSGSSTAEVTSFSEASSWKTLVCRSKGFDPAAVFKPHEIRRYDRLQQMAIHAADQAIGAVAMPAPHRCAIVVGVGWGASATLEREYSALLREGLRHVTPHAIPTVMANSVAGHLSIRYGFTGPSNTVGAACASGAVALGEAMWLLRSRRADLVLAGGVDAPISYGLMSFFSRMEAMSTNLEEPDLASRPFDAGRDGFVLGEGAGFLALTRASDAPLNTLGNLLGYGACSDAQHLVAPRADCSGMAACMSDAMRDAGVIPADIGHISAHGTSTVLNDSLEAAAIKMTFGSNSPPVTALKGAIGHLLGGAGSVQVVAAILAGRNGEVPPIAGLRNPDSSCDLNLVRRTAVPLSNSLALSNSFGFGGHNTSLVVAT